MKRKTIALLFAGAVFGIPSSLRVFVNIKSLIERGELETLVVLLAAGVAMFLLLNDLTSADPWD